VPFLNLTKRRGAGDAVSLEFVRQLVATGKYRVLEPGVVRDYLLRARVMLPGGVSLETTRLMLQNFRARLILSGTVLDFDDAAGPQGSTIRFSALVLDGASGEVLWSSRSANRGDDGVFFFGLGRVRTAPELTCKMVASTVRQMSSAGATRVAWSTRNQDKQGTFQPREPVPPPAGSPEDDESSDDESSDDESSDDESSESRTDSSPGAPNDSDEG
jgi:hypothetical protein